MASIGAGYGLPWRRREAAIAFVCAFVMLSHGAWAAGPRLLVLGDSLSAGYGLAVAEGFQAKLSAALRSAGRDVTLVDAAVSGDTSAGGRARLDWALAEGADAAIVELGANDALRALDPVSTEANLAAILDVLAKRKIPVLLTGMLAPPNFGAAYGVAFRDMFIRLSHRPGVIFDPFFLVDIAGDPALNQADHIHPNPEGVRRIVTRLLPAVLRLLDQVPK